MRKIKALAFLSALIMCVSLFAACNGAKLTGIEITRRPYNVDYTVGETFDKAGMVVTANFADSTSVVLSDKDYKISNEKALKTSDTEITVTYKKKTAVVKITVSAPVVYSTETEAKITDSINDALSAIPTEGAPDWLESFLEAAPEKVAAALKRAHITDAEVNNLIDFIKDYSETEFDMEDIDFVFGMADDFYAAGISNEKYAKFIWELANEFQEFAEDFISESVGDENADNYLSIYNGVIGIGKTEFVTIFKALFDISKLSHNVDADVLMSDELPSQNEFKDLLLALKQDALDTLNILGAEQISAFCNLFKAFTPLSAASFNDESYSASIENIELDLTYFKDRIAELTGYIEANPGEADWYQSEIDYYNGRISQAEEKRDFYRSMLGAGNEDKAIVYFNSIIDNAAADYTRLTVSLRASLNAINDAAITALYNAAKDGDFDDAAIALGKTIYAGLAAQGGLNNDTSVDMAKKYLGMIFDIACLNNDLSEEDYAETEELILSTINQIYTDAAALNALAYGAELDESFDDNIIINYFSGYGM